ncbi:MAG: hypothetical protein ACK4IX_06335 [Candidatus Sericytochromatia bacterium]
MESNEGAEPLKGSNRGEDNSYRSSNTPNDRPQGDRPYRNDRPEGGYRSQGDRPYRNDRPEGGYRPQGDRPYRNDRPEGGYRPQGDRPYRNDRPEGGYRPQGDRPEGDRPQGDRPYRNDRPEGSGDGYYRRSYNNNNSYGGRPRFSKPAKPKGRTKTETQMFILYKGEEVPTLFPVPVNASFPYFQRAIGMAEGTINDANEKGNGTVKIEGSDYPLKENRDPAIMKRYPMTKYIGKSIKFTFYPTITSKGIKMLRLEPDSAPFIKIANFRKELAKQGVVEAIGTIKTIEEKYFVVGIWSASSKKEYVVTIFGTADFKLGDFVKVDAVLENGVIKAETIRVFDIPPRRTYN